MECISAKIKINNKLRVFSSFKLFKLNITFESQISLNLEQYLQYLPISSSIFPQSLSMHGLRSMCDGAFDLWSCNSTSPSIGRNWQKLLQQTLYIWKTNRFIRGNAAFYCRLEHVERLHFDVWRRNTIAFAWMLRTWMHAIRNTSVLWKHLSVSY